MGEPVTSLKVVVFPGPQGVVYNAEKRPVHGNGLIEFKADKTPALQEEIWSIKQLIRRDELTRNARNSKQYSCPPIVDFNATKQYTEIRPEHRPKRIFNGFFPSKIRTTSHSNDGGVKEKQEAFFENLVPDPNMPPYQNGAVMGRVGSKSSSQRSEGEFLRTETPHRALQCIALASRGTVYSLRNGSPSPWINRYKLKQKSITACNAGQVKTKPATLMVFDQRGYSR